MREKMIGRDVRDRRIEIDDGGEKCSKNIDR